MQEVGCELCKRPHYNKDSPLKEEGKTLEEAYYTQFAIPFPQGGQYRAAALEFYQNTTIRNQGALIKALEIQIRQTSKVLQEMGSGSLPSSTEMNPKDHVNSISTNVKVDTTPIRHRTVKHPKGIAENILVGIRKFVFPVDFIILDMLEDINVPLIIVRPFLSTAHAKVDVFKRKITLRVGDEKIVFKSIKPASSVIKKVYMLGLRERMDLDLEARLMGETLILNRSFDPLYGDYIKLNDLNEPLELRRNRVDDLEPTVEEGEVVNEPMMDIVKTRCNFIGGLDDYPSNCDFALLGGILLIVPTL
ncbi:putative reverse transcriptase domain-containing protein [Tanacetum coccineum]